MRSLFILALAIVVSASTVFGQVPPPPGGGSAGGNTSMTPIIADARLDNDSPRLNDQVTVTWRYNDALNHLWDKFRATISLVNGPEVSVVGSSIVGGIEADGSRTHSFRLTRDLVGELNEPKRFKLRLVVGSHPQDLDLMVSPPNRAPVIDRVRAPGELITGQDLAVDADWREPDGDRCLFRVQRRVPSTGEWHNVNGEAYSLPMYVPIGEVPASVMTTFRLVITDRSGLPAERNFNVLLLPRPSAPPPPPDPVVAGGGAGAPVAPDPAPIASATTLTIALDPSTVRGGEKFSLTYTVTGPGAEHSVIETAQVQSQTEWNDLAIVGVVGNTLSCVAPLNTSTTSVPVQVRLNVYEGGGTTISAEATLTLDPSPPSAAPKVDPPIAQAPAAPAARSSNLREAVPLVPPPQNLDETELMPDLEPVYDPDTHRYILRKRVRDPSAPVRK